MKILALEFSSPQRSVAVLHGSEIETCEIVETGPGTAHALAMVNESLRQSKLEREQIERVVVGIGPGSYSGIRGAIALAQGWQLAGNVQLLGISSVECLATQAQIDGLSGRVNCVIDAQRDEFYVATYELHPGFSKTESTGLTVGAGEAERWREVEPLQLMSLARLRERERIGEVLIGPEVTSWFPNGRIVFPRAAVLAQWARWRNDFVDGEKLEPIYLRQANFVKAPPPRIQF